MSYLVANSEDRFSRDVAHILSGFPTLPLLLGAIELL